MSGFELKRIERVLRASSILPAGLRLHRSRCCRDTEDEEVAPLGPTHRARENPTDTVAREARQPGERLGIPNGDGQPINLTKFVEVSSSRHLKRRVSRSKRCTLDGAASQRFSGSSPAPLWPAGTP